MVFVLTESKARKIFERYDNVAAFGVGKSKGFSEDDLEISYSKLSFIPDEDEINAVIEGTMNGKKIIKSAVKALHKPCAENRDICISMAQIVNILSPEGKKSKKQEKKIRKNGPNIVVFVMDDIPEGDKIARKRNKFLVKYLSAIFGEFGIEPITADTKPGNKVIKKLFKGKRKKVVSKVTAFIHDNKKVRINDEGHILKKVLFTFYAIELRQSALRGLEIDDLTKDNTKTLLTTLIDTYTNDNMKVAGLASKKDDVKKICKQLKAKNKEAVKAYESFVEIMSQVNPDLKLPKVKSGYDKKDKAKMNVDKFIEFFTKKKCKNVGLLLMLYTHTAAVMMDATPGTAEYTKVMTGTISAVNADSSFSKAYIAAAKAWAKTSSAE